MGAYTDGLRGFGRTNWRCWTPGPSPPRCGISSLNIADYLLEEDVTLRDGETIGFSEGAACPSPTARVWDRRYDPENRLAW